MLPVFDFWNVVRLVAKALIVALKSPVAIFAGLCLAVSAVCISLRDLFGFDQMMVDGLSSALGNLPPGNGVSRAILYVVNMSAFINVFTWTWTFISRIVPGFLLLYGFFFSLVITYRAAHSLRQTYKDILK